MYLWIEIGVIAILIVEISHEAGPFTAILIGYFAIRSIGMILRLGKLGDIIEMQMKFEEKDGSPITRKD